MSGAGEGWRAQWRSARREVANEEEVEEEVLRREKERRAHVRVSESLCECLLFFKVREE